MSEWLQRQWYRLGLWHVLLIPLSWLFYLLITVRRLGYQIGLIKSYKLAVPVIVVGNITVGGTGKTPLVIWLVQHLQAAGFSPGVISRGYAGDTTGVTAVGVNSNPLIVGDEPVLLAKRLKCPVFVGSDRVAVAHALLEAHKNCDVIVSDDGLQHYRLQRDVEIAVIDAERRFGNARLLPAGPLREAISRLKKIDAIVYNGHANDDGYAMRLKSGAIQHLLDPAKTVSVAELAAGDILAIAGIGNPQRFFSQLQAMGLRFRQRAFADHHPFSHGDLQNEHADMILMTEKDAVKCAAFAQPNWWYLPVDAAVDEGLFDHVLQKLRN